MIGDYTQPSGGWEYEGYIDNVALFSTALSDGGVAIGQAAASGSDIYNYWQQGAVSFAPPPPRPKIVSGTYLGVGVGFQLNFTGPVGYGYTIWTATDVTLSPIESTWSIMTTGTFTNGVNRVTDPYGGGNPQQFYIISVP
jgi:hypothetical protein